MNTDLSEKYTQVCIFFYLMRYLKAHFVNETFILFLIIKGGRLALLEQSIDIDLFLGQLLTMVKSVVVKRSEEASKYETVDTRTKADRYIAMKEGGSSWSSFVLFDLDVMEAAGMNKQVIQSVYAGNKESIPYEFRD